MSDVLLSSAVLIGVIALLRAVLKDRIHPGLQYALWGLVLLRLLVPVSWFESPVSVAATAKPVAQAVSERLSAPDPIPTETDAISGADSPTEINATASQTVFRWIWLGGATLVGLWFLFVNLRLTCTLRRERRYHSTAGGIPVYVAGTIPSPCLFLGRIYLTETAAASPQVRYIISHELTHRRHGDGMWAFLRAVCLAVYWFDPFVWLAAVLSRRDGEIFCDAATVTRLGERHRFDYGRTLVDMTAVGFRPAELLSTATTMGGSARRLKERIARIAGKRRISAVLCALALVIAAAAVGCTFSSSKTKTFPETDPKISDPYTTPEPEQVEDAFPEQVEDISEEATDQFYGFPSIKPLPAESSVPILETADFGVFGTFWAGHENIAPDGLMLTEYLTGCTMTPIYSSEEGINLQNTGVEILITVDSVDIFLGVPDVSIPHFAVITTPDKYILCVLNDGDQIFEDIKAMLAQFVMISATPSYHPAESASPTPVVTEAETQPSPIPEHDTPPDPEEDTSTTDSTPSTTPAPETRDPSTRPIADTPENLWGENWRDGLTEEQIARLESE